MSCRLEFKFFFHTLRFVLQTVECGYDVSVLVFSVVVRQLVERKGRNCYEVFRIEQVNFLVLLKTVDGVVTRHIHFFFGFGSRPEQVISIGHPHGFYFAGLARCFVVDVVEGGLKGPGCGDTPFRVP